MPTVVVIGAGIAACLGTRALIPLLRRAAVLDRPNERSSHAIPTPRGGGIAVVAASLAAWLVLIAAGAAPMTLLAVIAGAAMLAADLLARRSARFVAGGPVRRAMRRGRSRRRCALPEGAVFQGWLPAGLDMAAAALLWVWFVNLYNFMDGIDGIAGSETAAIGIGLALFADCRHRRRSRRSPRSRRRNRRRRDRVPGVELGAGAHLSRRCRQRAARLSARLSAARRRVARTLEDRADPAAVFPRRRDDHAAAPPPARRARLAAASRAFLSAGGAARSRPCRRRAAGDRREPDPDRLPAWSPRPSRARSASRSRRQPCSCCWRALPEGAAAPIPRPIRPMEGRLKEASNERRAAPGASDRRSAAR